MLDFINTYRDEKEEEADFQAVLNHASRLGLQYNGYPDYSSSHGCFTVQAVCYSLGDYSGWVSIPMIVSRVRRHELSHCG